MHLCCVYMPKIKYQEFAYKINKFLDGKLLQYQLQCIIKMVSGFGAYSNALFWVQGSHVIFAAQSEQVNEAARWGADLQILPNLPRTTFLRSQITPIKVLLKLMFKDHLTWYNIILLLYRNFWRYVKLRVFKEQKSINCKENLSSFRPQNCPKTWNDTFCWSAGWKTWLGAHGLLIMEIILLSDETKKWWRHIIEIQKKLWKVIAPPFYSAGYKVLSGQKTFLSVVPPKNWNSIHYDAKLSNKKWRCIERCQSSTCLPLGTSPCSVLYPVHCRAIPWGSSRLLPPEGSKWK